MDKVKEYAEKLKVLENWDEYLMRQSGLPGPRGNLELIQAVAEIGSEELFLHLISFSADKAAVNTPEEFLAACGTVGLGRLVSEGRKEYMEALRGLASDPRWRTREAVAMALQLYGEADMDGLLGEMKLWAQGNAFEKRAAAAALCEPKLLKNGEQVSKVLAILDGITESIVNTGNRRDEGFIALRKGMAYCWSVAIAHNPGEGKRLFEKWLSTGDRDIKWIIKENLKKNRLKKLDEAWVQACIDKVK